MTTAELQPPKRLRWYIFVDSKVYGPFDRTTLAQMVERNQILDDDKVQIEGGSSWISAKHEPHLTSLFQNLAPPPVVVGKGRSWSRRVVTLSYIAVFGGVLWVAWPYYALLSLMTAVREGDVSTLERRVDWNNVRQGLRGDLNASIIKLMGNKGNSDDAMGKGLAALFGPAVINNMVDGYVTPQGVAALARNQKQSEPSTNPSAVKNIDQIRKIDWDKVTYAFFDGSPFSFRADIVSPDPEVKQPFGLELSWSGDWRLVRVRLPTGLMDSQSAINAKLNSPIKTPQKKVIEPSPIDLTLISKKFREANFRARPAVDSAIEFQLAIVNRDKQALQAFDGVLTFTDLLDNELLSTKLAINQPLPMSDGPYVLWSGELEYNQFMESHKRLRSAELQNIKIKFLPRKLLYADGSTKEFE